MLFKKRNVILIEIQQITLQVYGNAIQQHNEKGNTTHQLTRKTPRIDQIEPLPNSSRDITPNFPKNQRIQRIEIIFKHIIIKGNDFL